MSDNAVDTFFWGVLFAFLIGMIALLSWRDVEVARAEHARIEHGCATPEVER
jgi:hypothetical protein